MSRLFLRLALAFVAFVIAGSLALVLWLGAEERRQSQELFAAMARTNARFLQTGAPLTDRTALSLREVLGVKVYFESLNGSQIPNEPMWSPQPYGELKAVMWNHHDLVADASGEVRKMPDGQEAVAVPLRDDIRLVLLRERPPLGAWKAGRTYAVLGAFWLISLALAGALARGIVRPLRTLAARLPHIADDGDEPLPEAARADEIGELARAYQTTRRQLADERRAREQAERLATLGRMATGLAHEINNPVSAIKLHAQLLETDVANESLAMILSENAKIEALVNQWMFLARPQPPAVAPCDIATLVAEALRTVAPAAAHAKVKVISEATSRTVQGDKRRLGQAITNVMMNAIHAMARGGELRIESAGNSLIFRDTGPGFSATALARATELFYSEKEGGMGIGLSVTAEILKAHGGELRIENSADGAVVTFILPDKL